MGQFLVQFILLGGSILSATQQPDINVLNFALDEVLKSGEWIGEITERHKSGKEMTIEERWTLLKDPDGKPKSIFAIKSDVSQRKLAEEQIRQLAFYDQLTSLPNRRLLLDRLDKALSASLRSKQIGAIMFIDLDNFKILNDTLGHEKGDTLLQLVATRLKLCVRDEDTVARFGGDEFVIMIENLDSEIDQAASFANMVGNKILNELNHTFDLDGYQHLSTPSIGITLFNNNTKSVSELIKQADAAMYKSKAAGRNRLTFF